MTTASLFFRHRHAPALLGASVMLHFVALWWILPRLGPVGVVPPPPPAIVVRLVAAPAPADPAPAPAPAAAAKRPARSPPAPMAAIAPQEGAPAMAGQASAVEIFAAVQSNEPATVAPEPIAPEPIAPEPEPPAAHVVEAAAPRYRVDVPPSARIVLDVARRDADGTLWHGEAAMAWQLQGGRYRVKVEAGIRVLVARVNLVVLESEGKIGAAGFAPETMTEKRRGRGPTATHFSERDGRITFSGSPAAFDLVPGAQDKATVPLQLAAIARGDSSQLDGGIEILVGEDKDASVFRFGVLGLEELDTRLGKIQAWRLSRPPRAGAYGSRLDIWLAPAHGWLPVQISNTEASGAVTTQTVNKIIITDSGS